MSVLRFHRNPRVVRIVEPMPTGSKPHVCPKTLWLMDISCSPLGKVVKLARGVSGRRGRGSYGVKNPCDVFIRDCEHGFA